jgi:hypothetical protein
MYKTGMTTMLSNSLIKDLNVNRRTCHIGMKVVSFLLLRGVVGCRGVYRVRESLESLAGLQKPYVS